MKIELKKNLRIAGRHTPAGEAVEVDDRIAKDLILSGRAVEVVDAPKKKAAPPPSGKKENLVQKILRKR